MVDRIIQLTKNSVTKLIIKHRFNRIRSRIESAQSDLNSPYTFHGTGGYIEAKWKLRLAMDCKDNFLVDHKDHSYAHHLISSYDRQRASSQRSQRI